VDIGDDKIPHEQWLLDDGVARVHKRRLTHHSQDPGEGKTSLREDNTPRTSERSCDSALGRSDADVTGSDTPHISTGKVEQQGTIVAKASHDTYQPLHRPPHLHALPEPCL
jgi:hypothetical protein